MSIEADEAYFRQKLNERRRQEEEEKRRQEQARRGWEQGAKTVVAEFDGKVKSILTAFSHVMMADAKCEVTGPSVNHNQISWGIRSDRYQPVEISLATAFHGAVSLNAFSIHGLRGAIISEPTVDALRTTLGNCSAVSNSPN